MGLGYIRVQGFQVSDEKATPRKTVRMAVQAATGS